MKVNAQIAKQMGRSYSVFVDGVDISDCCVEADNIAHTATVLVRTRRGDDVRRQPDGKRLMATLFGEVVIVEQVGAVAIGGHA